MSNYIPHYTKKQRTLQQREAALQRFVAEKAPKEKIRSAAIEVLKARVRLLKAKRATITPKGDYVAQFEAIDKKIVQLESTPVARILREFGAEDIDDRATQGTQA